MKKFILLFAIISCVWAMLVFAQTQDPKFSHKFHAEDVEATCDACHEAALSSNSSSDDLLPDHENCYACHDEDETECGYCHNDPDNPQPAVRITEIKVNFAHAEHADTDKDCMKCHAGIEQDDGTAMTSYMPGQNDCAECHGVADFSEEKGICLTCHSEDFNFVPETHSLLWEKKITGRPGNYRIIHAVIATSKIIVMIAIRATILTGFPTHSIMLIIMALMPREIKITV